MKTVKLVVRRGCTLGMHVARESFRGRLERSRCPRAYVCVGPWKSKRPNTTQTFLVLYPPSSNLSAAEKIYISPQESL